MINVEAHIREHIHMVAAYLHECVKHLLIRADTHDVSKLAPPEFDVFCRHIDSLGEHPFGSAEYDAIRECMKVALDHHYENNTHHPETRGIEAMNLFDVIEMVCDWCAAASTHPLGDIDQSLDVCEKRFGIDKQLMAVIKNTVKHIARKEADATT